MRVTAIEHQPRRRRYEVQIDFVLSLMLSAEIFATACLRVGQEISLERVTELEEVQARHFAMSSAMRLLAYRPRSEKEMRSALQRRGVKPEVVAETMARLKAARLLDDGEFTRSYLDARDRNSPRSRRLLRAELLSKGVTPQTSEERLAEINEADAAYRAAAKRARALTEMPYADFQRRLGEFLLRRGFDYDTARETVNRLWSELRNELPDRALEETPY